MCKYGGNPYSRTCRRFFNEIREIKDYIINNPVGYVYKKNKNKFIRRPLSAWYDRDSRKYFYYVVDYKGRRPRRHDIILHTIKNKGQMLRDKDIILVPTRGQMTVKIYDDPPFSPYRSHKYGVIYGDSFIQPLSHPHYGFAPRSIDIHTYRSYWRTVGYIKSKNNFYKLYEKEYPRSNYRYRVQIYPGFFLDVVDKTGRRKSDKHRFRHRLYQGDVVQIDTMKGDLIVYRYKDMDITSL